MANKLTLQHFKDEVAKEVGINGIRFKSWQDMVNVIGYPIQKSEQAANRFAQYLAGEAWEKACKEQKTLCANAATLEPSGMLLQVDKESILECENAANPYKQTDI